MDTLTAIKNRPPAPDLGYTWAQAPAVLEDALGRCLTIPSEYDWEVRSPAFLIRDHTN